MSIKKLRAYAKIINNSKQLYRFKGLFLSMNKEGGETVY